MKTLILMLLFQCVCNWNPPFIPRWEGSDPIRYCVDPTAEPYRVEILMALKVWEKEFIYNSFVEVFDPTWHRTIVFRVTPFGPGNSFFALAMYPPPLIVEPYAGDVTLNSDYNWNDPYMRFLLVPTWIHEIGHSLGVGDSRSSSNVMFPNINPKLVELSVEDKRLFRCLYNGECR